MKKLSMVVHSSLQQGLADCLRSLHLETFMFSHIEEHSSQLEHDAFLSARDRDPVRRGDRVEGQCQTRIDDPIEGQDEDLVHMASLDRFLSFSPLRIERPNV